MTPYIEYMTFHFFAPRNDLGDSSNKCIATWSAPPRDFFLDTICLGTERRLRGALNGRIHAPKPAKRLAISWKKAFLKAG
jgi:hypothetical protein